MAATGGKRQADDHFGSESLWILRAPEIGGEGKQKEASRANLNGGELDCENASGIHKGVIRGKGL